MHVDVCHHEEYSCNIEQEVCSVQLEASDLHCLLSGYWIDSIASFTMLSDQLPFKIAH